MKVIDVLAEDFVNYKKPSMHVAFPYCSFKCDKDCGKEVCQNSKLALAPRMDIPMGYICDCFVNNPISEAIVFAGLEPFDSFTDVISLICKIRERNILCPIIIYTGYTEEECEDKKILTALRGFTNIIVKFGRFKPDEPHHWDDVLGVELASSNQYAKIIC